MKKYYQKSGTLLVALDADWVEDIILSFNDENLTDQEKQDKARNIFDARVQQGELVFCDENNTNPFFLALKASEK